MEKDEKKSAISDKVSKISIFPVRNMSNITQDIYTYVKNIY